MSGKLDWAAIGSGLIPDLNQWNEPAARLQEFLANVPEAYRDFWKGEIIANQRSVMIGAAATAVGINMTFLLPYSMLDRGWDKPFRGLARFDLSTGMAIPYILVTSCVVIAASSAFHAQADADFLSNDPVAMQKSNVFGGATKVLTKRLILENESAFEGVVPEDKAARVAELASQLSEDEKQLAAALVKRNAFHLSESLAPLLGEGNARMVFGIGVFAMGFSTIIILMLINGYAFCEIFNQELGGFAFYFGALLSGVAGASWFYFWSGDSRFWLTIVASIFGMMLLPIAYFTFLLMMNSRKILRDEKPTGLSMMVWNVLMVFALVGAILGAGSAIATKASDPKAGPIVIGMAGVYLVLVVLGFVFKSPGDPDDEDEDY